MKGEASIHPDLLTAQKFAYEPNGWRITHLIKEPESEEYGAFQFNLNQRSILFRVAKITPTKGGQFVTLWKRMGTGPIFPYDAADPVDLFVISVSQQNRFGQFIFPKAVLLEKGILSNEGKGGKRAIRVYPPWDSVDSWQAQKTQSWQILYFFEISPPCSDLLRMQKLFEA